METQCILHVKKHLNLDMNPWTHILTMMLFLQGSFLDLAATSEYDYYSVGFEVYAELTDGILLPHMA
jgi:hypothetical protein